MIPQTLGLDFYMIESLREVSVEKEDDLNVKIDTATGPSAGKVIASLETDGAAARAQLHLTAHCECET